MNHEYELFLLPNTISYFYPKSVLQILNLVGNLSVAITLDKEYLSTKSPDTVCIERVQSDGSLLENNILVEHIQQLNPRVVILDNCFWDASHLNSSLLESLLQIQLDVPFLLINILPLVVFNDIQSQNLVQLKLAKRVLFPKCSLNQATTQYYENTELETDVDNLLQKDNIDADVYKKAFHLFQGIQSLTLKNHLYLFSFFLEKLRLENPDKHLMNLVLTVHKYFFERLERLQPVFSVQDINGLSERLNRPVFQLIMNNRSLFDKLASFFTQTPPPTPTSALTHIKTL